MPIDAIPKDIPGKETEQALRLMCITQARLEPLAWSRLRPRENGQRVSGGEWKDLLSLDPPLSSGEGA